MPFHISTQANISNLEAARLYEEMGAERIILARELSLRQISEIKTDLNSTEIECFVHGSMCTSISGRCYFSASICESQEFSANRGNCIQPCRRTWRVYDDQNNEFIYDGKMFLNAKDLCMIEYIQELIEAEIDAFKIEGRMKGALYVKTVAECYREAIECYFDGTYNKKKVQTWLKRLASVYNRGFHTGFYFDRPTVEEIELERRGNISPYRRTYIGKIVSFDKKSKSANIIIEKREFFLRIGDQIIISGKNSYHIDNVTKLIVDGKKVNEIMRKKNQNPLKVNLPLNHEVNPDTKIFKISKKGREEKGYERG
jgi:putative protease